jgi:thioredoxin
MKKTFQLALFALIISSTAWAQKPAEVKIVELNAQSFKQKVWNFDKNKSFVREGKLPIILDFYATWCRPCKMLSPHLDAIQKNYNGKLVIYRIDVDQQPELAQRFNIQAMPTVIYMNKTSYKADLGYKEYSEIENLVKSYFFGGKK